MRRKHTLNGICDICVCIRRVIDDTLAISDHFDSHLSNCKRDLEFGNSSVYGECIWRATTLEGDSSCRGGEDRSPHWILNWCQYFIKVLLNSCTSVQSQPGGFSNTITICDGSSRIRAGPEVNYILLLKKLKANSRWRLRWRRTVMAG